MTSTQEERNAWCDDDIFIHNSFYQSDGRKCRTHTKTMQRVIVVLHQYLIPRSLLSPSLSVINKFFCCISSDFVFFFFSLPHSAFDAVTVVCELWTRWCYNPLASRYPHYLVLCSVFAREADREKSVCVCVRIW